MGYGWGWKGREKREEYKEERVFEWNGLQKWERKRTEKNRPFICAVLEVTGFSAGLYIGWWVCKYAFYPFKRMKRTKRSLNPLLFNLYMLLWSKNVSLSSYIRWWYSDILLTWIRSTHIKNQLNLALKNFSLFLRDLNFSILPSKLTFIVFFSIKSRNLNLLLRSNNNVRIRIHLEAQIPFSWSSQFLSVQLESDLS